MPPGIKKDTWKFPEIVFWQPTRHPAVVSLYNSARSRLSSFDSRLLWTTAGYLRARSMRALAGMGALAVPHLSDALSEESGVRLIYVAYTLGEIGPAAKSVVPVLEAITSRMRTPKNLVFIRVTGRALKRIDPEYQTKPGR